MVDHPDDTTGPVGPRLHPHLVAAVAYRVVDEVGQRAFEQPGVGVGPLLLEVHGDVRGVHRAPVHRVQGTVDDLGQIGAA